MVVVAVAAPSLHCPEEATGSVVTKRQRSLLWSRAASLQTAEHSTTGRTKTAGRTSDCTRLQ